MDTSTRIILERGRTYWKPADKREKAILQVWSKHIMDLRKLVLTYGGNYYTHKTGFIYQLSTKEDLLRVAQEIYIHTLDIDMLSDALTPQQHESLQARLGPIMVFCGYQKLPLHPQQRSRRRGPSASS